MAQKKVEVPGLGLVVLQKRRGTKNLRLSISPNGQIRVGLPTWTPYAVGVAFARSRHEWINKHRSLTSAPIFYNGSQIGKSHRLYFRSAVSSRALVTSRVNLTEVIIKTDLPHEDSVVQLKARQAGERALRIQAETLLPQRVASLALQYGYNYSDLSIKKLTSRWGSCSSGKNITLSLFLMQLPWELIDYVIAHELVHTKHLNHSSKFWKDVEKAIPNAKQARRKIKKYTPTLSPRELADDSMA